MRGDPSPDRPAELAHAIRDLAADAARRARLGQAARDRALAEFSWEDSNRALVALCAGLGLEPA